jgi:Tol biopolymer transport system component
MNPVKHRSLIGYSFQFTRTLLLTCAALALLAVVLGVILPGRLMAYSTTFTIGLVDVGRGLWIKMLTSTGIPLGCPIWSSDGDQLAVYQREPDGTNSIYLIPLSGMIEKYVPQFASTTYSIYGSFVWSPDSRAIAFFAIDNDTSAAGLWKYDLAQQELREITQTDFADNVSLAWSADAQSLWYLSNAANSFSIYHVNVHDLQPQPVLNETGNAFSFRLSHDERYIVYDVLSQRQYDIYRMNANGGNRLLLTSADASDLHPLWSPGDQQLAFYSSRDGKSEIYLMNMDGGELKRLTDNNAQEVQVAWSPDGRQIAYVSYRQGLAQIYTIDATGATERQITHDPTNKYCPAWQPTL